MLITSGQTTPQPLYSRQEDESREASGRSAVARDLGLLDREEEAQVENGFRAPSRRVMASLVALVYHRASVPQKQHILQKCMTATGYARTYAQWLLNHVEEIFAPPQALRRRYGPEVFAAVLVSWILVCSYHLL